MLVLTVLLVPIQVRLLDHAPTVELVRGRPNNHHRAQIVLLEPTPVLWLLTLPLTA